MPNFYPNQPLCGQNLESSDLARGKCRAGARRSQGRPSQGRRPRGVPGYGLRHPGWPLTAFGGGSSLRGKIKESLLSCEVKPFLTGLAKWSLVGRKLIVIAVQQPHQLGVDEEFLATRGVLLQNTNSGEHFEVFGGSLAFRNTGRLEVADAAKIFGSRRRTNFIV